MVESTTEKTTEIVNQTATGGNTPANGQPNSTWNAGILNIQRGNDVLIEASMTPAPKKLWDCLWYEGEVGCCFSDSNTGKSIYCVQIADAIANQGYIVLYFDFELTKKQFEQRYCDENRHYHQFSPNFYRVEIDRDKFRNVGISDFESMILNSIREAIELTKAKVLIIDNITYLCMNSEKRDNAADLMLRLLEFKVSYGLSVLVLAHTPKRLLETPITQNNLAGSKLFYNMLDSAFAIGKSVKDGGMRYVKQIKVRYGDFTYDENNVLVYEIDKKDAFTQFVFQGYSSEYVHLKQTSEDDMAKIESEVTSLIQQGLSYRHIAMKMGISKSLVGKIGNRCKPK